MKILLVNGPPGSGKDSVYSILADTKDRVAREKFSAPLYAASALRIGVRSVAEVEALKGSDKDQRGVMIGLSERQIKPMFGDGFFGARCACECMKIALWNIADLVVVTDAGFGQEVGAFCEMLEMCAPGDFEVHLWTMIRPGTSFSGDSRERIGPDLMDSGLVKDYRVIHNNGSLDDLRKVVVETAIESGLIEGAQ